MSSVAFIMIASLLASPTATDAHATEMLEPVLALNFESEAAATVHLRTQFAAPDRVPGVSGDAWRTDGFSAWGSAPLDLSGAVSLTASLWVALESYPSDLEVPTNRLSPSSFLNQTDRSAGFALEIDTFGRWGLLVATTRGDVRVQAPDLYPLGRWTHLAARIDGEADAVTLFLDGAPVASAPMPSGAVFRPANAPLLLARGSKEVEMINFTINRLNGAFDEVEIHDRALGDDAVGALFDKYGANLPSADPSMIVPESRFAADPLRPRVHPMPPANWTNEPHGLVRSGGAWHMFYQRTPNGPFKTQMTWGHMVSDDLVSWRDLPDALRPSLQNDVSGFDMKGIWSGDVIVEGDTAFAFYTSVNHGERLSAFNPGISVAVSDDPDLRTWRKLGPILNTRHVEDFRDPYLWSEDGVWHMIIGAAYEQGGGLDYYVYRDGEDGKVWEHQPRFTALPYPAMDIDSIIWEMPVFEPLSDDIHVLVVNPIGGSVSKYGEKATRAVYWTGRWQDGLFHPFETEPQPLDVLPGHLAPTVERADDGRLRAIGIIDERRSPQAQEDAGWAHVFSLPRSWFLMPDGRTLGQAPAPELVALRGDALVLDSQRLDQAGLEIAADLHAYELEVSLADLASGATVGLDLLASADGREVTRLSFDAARGEVVLDKSRSTLSSEEEGPRVLREAYDKDRFGPVRTIRVLVDGSVVEVFINDAAAFSFRAYPTLADSTRARLFAEGTPVDLSRVTVWPLRRPE